jgi:hypothetical protein
VPSVLAAAGVCPEITSARIAAQLMAVSQFNPNRLGSDGAQGIAQFLPQVWQQYAPSPSATPWDAGVAIPALGRAMCDLVQAIDAQTDADAFPLALAAYQWGMDMVRGAGFDIGAPGLAGVAQQAIEYLDFYANDPRLSSASHGPPPAAPAPGTASDPPSTVNPPPATTTAAAASISPTRKPDTLVGHGSGKCLSSATGVDGRQLEIWTCDGTVSQRWTFSGDTIRSQGLCMDAAWGDTANGTKVQVATCSGNVAQRFQLRPDGSIYSPTAGRCLDIVSVGTANGAKLQLWDCTGSSNQLWYFR